MSFLSAIATKYPNLKKELRMARIDKTPEQVIKENIRNTIILAAGISLMLFMYFDRTGGPMILIPLFFFAACLAFFNFGLMKIKSRIAKQAKEIDKDVLFSGRYLLVKLNSGQPLINSLMDAASSYGVANSYFREIMKDIQLGKPIEKALEDASEYSPSKKFKKILFQISNALKIGIDVTEFLDATLDEIADEQIIEIQRYGKKLSSITLFYMLGGVVFPSLGFTILIVVAGLTNIDTSFSFFLMLLVLLSIIQLVFLIVYKSIRPNINI